MTDFRKSVEVPVISQEKHRVSERKLAANRANAQKSTGPKTARGKTFSRYNAFKHGLFANFAFIPGKEDPKKFTQLIRDLREQYQPVGREEEILVEEIAVNRWRKARLLRHESGEIRSNIDAVHEGYAESEIERASPEQRQFYDWLKRAEKAVEREGLVPHRLKEQLASLLDPPEVDSLIERLIAYPLPGFDLNRPEDRAENKLSLLALLCEYKEPLAELIEWEDENLEIMESLAAFPDGPAANKILQFQTAFEKELQRIITQLMFLQEQRRRAEQDFLERTQEVS